MKRNIEAELKIKDLTRAAVLAMVLILLAVSFPFFVSCTDIGTRVMRLHVLANSDSPGDQQEKLTVRDAVLAEAAKYYDGAESMEQASSRICTHLQAIERAGQDALEKSGGSGRVQAEVCEMYFTTRDYGDFTLPAGKYRTLRVTIGEGRGKNWWCVVFPELCLPAAAGENGDAFAALPENERRLIEEPEKFEVRFKIVEWYESLRELFR